MAGFNWYQNSKSEPCSVDVNCVPLCSLADVQLRFLCPSDLDEVRALCQDWFPIEYPLAWYEDITSQSNFYALAAVYKHTIIGLIVSEIKQYEDLNSEDEDILPKAYINTAEYGYILSLGVSKQFRRNGIASLLLDSFISHLTTSEKGCVKAIFLHVLTTNTTAIKFYEHRHFHLHKFLPYYYSIRGRCKDGFTYVLYINGGHPSWTVFDYFKYWYNLAWKAGSLALDKVISVLHWLWSPPSHHHRHITTPNSSSSRTNGCSSVIS